MTPPLRNAPPTPPDPDDRHGTQPIRMDVELPPATGTQPIRMEPESAPETEKAAAADAAPAEAEPAPPPRRVVPRVRAADPAAVRAVPAGFGGGRLELGTRRSRLNWQSVAVSLMVHVALIVLAGFLTVLVVHGRPRTMFEASPQPQLRPRQLEHTIRVKQMEQQVRKPEILERLVAQAPGPVALPELPDIRTPSLQDMRDSPLMSDMGSLIGAMSPVGGAAGRSLTGGAGYTDVTFFGVQSRTRAVSILFDVTGSMRAKGVLEEGKEEAIKLIRSLNPTTQFNLIVFVTGAVPFSPDQMAFATEENKQKAIDWLNDGARATPGSGFSLHHEIFRGTSPLTALKLAVEMGSDAIFLITDMAPRVYEGQFQVGPLIEPHPRDVMNFIRTIRTNYGRDVRINPILWRNFTNPRLADRDRDTRTYYRQVARTTGGTVEEVRD